MHASPHRWTWPDICPLGSASHLPLLHQNLPPACSGSWLACFFSSPYLQWDPKTCQFPFPVIVRLQMLPAWFPRLPSPISQPRSWPPVCPHTVRNADGIVNPPGRLLAARRDSPTRGSLSTSPLLPMTSLCPRGPASWAWHRGPGWAFPRPRPVLVPAASCRKPPRPLYVASLSPSVFAVPCKKKKKKKMLVRWGMLI